MSSVDDAVDALAAGKPVLVHDDGDREDEVDMVYAAEHVEPRDVARLRNDAGGLICVAVHPGAAERYGLPFMHDVVDPALAAGDLDYDSRSSFSLWVNHRSTRTGITDRERSKTIRELASAADAAVEGAGYSFPEEFRSPGHVAVLRADEALLHGRQGHTEMAVELAVEADVEPAAVVCEMLDDETGEALEQEDAREYAREEGLVFVQGRRLVEEVLAGVSDAG